MFLCQVFYYRLKVDKQSHQQYISENKIHNIWVIGYMCQRHYLFAEFNLQMQQNSD